MMTLSLAMILMRPQSTSVDPAKIVSDMLLKYRETQTLAGTITLTVSDGVGKSSVETRVQYAKPSKLYIRQAKSGNPKAKLVTSDGKHFSYDLPENQGLVATDMRMIEAIKNLRGETQTVQDVYAVATASLYDRSAALDIIISRKEDLEYLNFQWASITYVGKGEVDGRPVHVITGQWRPYGTAPVMGQYEFAISMEGDLLRYVQKEQYKINGVTALATYLYDVRVTRGAKPDESLFTVVL